MASSLAQNGQIQFCKRIGSDDLENLSGFHARYRSTRLDYRNRA